MLVQEVCLEAVGNGGPRTVLGDPRRSQGETAAGLWPGRKVVVVLRLGCIPSRLCHRDMLEVRGEYGLRQGRPQGQVAPGGG